MEAYSKLLNCVKFVGGSILSVGVLMFSYGFFISNSMLTGLGLGAAVGAIFIFIMGVFFVVTEEMLENTDKGTIVVPAKYSKNVVPFKLK